jgi:putative oxidoreductase
MSNKRNIVTWVLTLLAALAFVAAGFAKVSGQEAMVQSFNLFGLPAWFRVTIGALEIVGGVLLLLPALTGTAAFGLSIVMLGAIACHAMFTPIAMGLPAAVLFAILTYIYLTRKNVVPQFLQKVMVG